LDDMQPSINQLFARNEMSVRQSNDSGINLTDRVICQIVSGEKSVISVFGIIFDFDSTTMK
jgi:hypothetical protein